MDQAMAERLQVNPLRRGISGQKDPQWAEGGIGLKLGLNMLAFILIHAPIKDLKASTLGKSMGSQDGLQVSLCGAVLGENDHPFIIPLPIGF